MGERGQYLYAVTRELDPAALEVTGMGGRPLRVVEHRGLAAVVSTVDLDEFGEEALHRHLEDLDWLEQTARNHDAVVQAVAERGPTAPMRLATIFHSDDGVRDRLDEWHDALTAALDRVAGRYEWSVKAYASTAPRSEPAPASSGPGAGAAYLQRKRAETVSRQTAEEEALRLAEEVHATLAEQSVASRRLRPQDPRLTGHEGTMSLNGAYLVDETRAEEFTAVARKLAEEHPEARLEVNGPWPPYSFATLEQP